jgi:hypothetical protein
MNEPAGGQGINPGAMITVINAAPVEMLTESNGRHWWHWLNGAADVADYQTTRGDGGKLLLHNKYFLGALHQRRRIKNQTGAE